MTVSPDEGREDDAEEDGAEEASEEAGGSDAADEDGSEEAGGREGSDEIAGREEGGSGGIEEGSWIEGGAVSDASDSVKEIGGADEEEAPAALSAVWEDSGSSEDEPEDERSEPVGVLSGGTLSSEAESAELSFWLSSWPFSSGREGSGADSELPGSRLPSAFSGSIGVSPREFCWSVTMTAVSRAGSSADVMLSLAKANSTISPQSSAEDTEA